MKARPHPHPMEILTKIFEILNNKIALPVALFGALLLFLPDSVLAYLALDEFARGNRTLLALFFLFALISYLYEKVKALLSYMKQSSESRKSEAKRLEGISRSLNSLDQAELTWIYYCLRENRRTIIANGIDATATSLESKYIVTRPRGPHSIMDTPFTITDAAWDYIQERRDHFCPKEYLGDAAFNAKVDDRIGDFRKVF